MERYILTDRTRCVGEKSATYSFEIDAQGLCFGDGKKREEKKWWLVKLLLTVVVTGLVFFRLNMMGFLKWIPGFYGENVVALLFAIFTPCVCKAYGMLMFLCRLVVVVDRMPCEKFRFRFLKRIL
jgi:hypothetical protein